jgi:hypothetical protein
MKKYTSIFLQDLPFKIDFLQHWLSDEEPKRFIISKDIEYWKSLFGKSETCEMSDVIELDKFMQAEKIDVIILI